LTSQAELTHDWPYQLLRRWPDAVPWGLSAVGNQSYVGNRSIALPFDQIGLRHTPVPTSSGPPIASTDGGNPKSPLALALVLASPFS